MHKNYSSINVCSWKNVSTYLQFIFSFLFFSDFPVILNHATEVRGKKVRVVWSSLSKFCPVESYKVYFRKVLTRSGKTKWTSVYVSSKETHHTLDLQCQKEYEIAVTAKISSGETPFNHSSWWKVKTGQGTTSWITNVFKCSSTPSAISFMSFIFNGILRPF